MTSLPHDRSPSPVGECFRGFEVPGTDFARLAAESLVAPIGLSAGMPGMDYARLAAEALVAPIPRALDLTPITESLRRGLAELNSVAAIASSIACGLPSTRLESSVQAIQSALLRSFGGGSDVPSAPVDRTPLPVPPPSTAERPSPTPRRRGRRSIEETWDPVEFHRWFRESYASAPRRRAWRRPLLIDVAGSMGMSDRHLRRLLSIFGWPEELRPVRCFAGPHRK